jgi:hypothetical protein
VNFSRRQSSPKHPLRAASRNRFAQPSHRCQLTSISKAVPEASPHRQTAAPTTTNPAGKCLCRPSLPRPARSPDSRSPDQQPSPSPGQRATQFRAPAQPPPASFNNPPANAPPPQGSTVSLTANPLPGEPMPTTQQPTTQQPIPQQQPAATTPPPPSNPGSRSTSMTDQTANAAWQQSNPRHTANNSLAQPAPALSPNRDHQDQPNVQLAAK